MLFNLFLISYSTLRLGTYVDELKIFDFLYITLRNIKYDLWVIRSKTFLTSLILSDYYNTVS